jgi:hypothetical protein
MEAHLSIKLSALAIERIIKCLIEQILALELLIACQAITGDFSGN